MALLEENQFLLGIFAANCSGGQSATKVPERWDPSWSNNVTLAKMADEAGLEFMLPIARWIGYGGETDFEGNSLETFMWACGLVAETKRLKFVVTAHNIVHNPVVAAKMIATIDHISNSRIALNIVAGWNKREFDALGIELPASHDTRYACAEEWCNILKALWVRTEPFDWDGKFWQLKHVRGEPRPLRIPTILNAAGSGEGRDFATRNADVLFTICHTLERAKADIAELKEKARANGRSVEVFTTTYVVCRPTSKEAEDYLDFYAGQHGDWEAVDCLVDGLMAQSKIWPKEAQDKLRFQIAAGHGSWPVVGDPEQVAKSFIALHEVGFAGTTISFVDYIKELPYFCQEVLPRLEKAGIRRPVLR